MNADVWNEILQFLHPMHVLPHNLRHLSKSCTISPATWQFWIRRYFFAIQNDFVNWRKVGSNLCFLYNKYKPEFAQFSIPKYCTDEELLVEQLHNVGVLLTKQQCNLKEATRYKSIDSTRHGYYFGHFGDAIYFEMQESQVDYMQNASCYSNCKLSISFDFCTVHTVLDRQWSKNMVHFELLFEMYQVLYVPVHLRTIKWIPCINIAAQVCELQTQLTHIANVYDSQPVECHLTFSEHQTITDTYIMENVLE